MDDFSRYTWVHLIKFKSEVADIFIKFVKYAEIQFNFEILCIKSDNAKELCEGNLKNFLETQGIIHQTSCSYTSR